MQKHEAAQLVCLLSAAYPHRPVPAETSEIYEAMLMDLEFDLAKRAVSRLIATSTFLPTIAEIRKTATELELGPVRAGGEAWGDVVAAIRFVGAYGVPRFEDPIVAKCVECLGWRALCLGENEVSDRARFCELYESLATRSRTDEVARSEALQLPGRVTGRLALKSASSGQPEALAGLLRLPSVGRS